MYLLIRDESLLDDIYQTLDKGSLLFCDTETYIEEGKTKGGLYGKIRLFQIYQEGWTEAILFDCMFVSLDKVLALVKDFTHVYHHGAYDLHTINCHTKSLWLPRDIEDTLYLSRLALYKKTSRFGFYECLKATGLADDTIEGMNKKENQKADWGGRLTPTMLKYAACDVLYMSLLYPLIKDQWDTESYQLDIFNLKYAIEYSRRGIPVNQDKIKDMLLEATVEYERVLNILPVNPNSPKQVCAYLGTDKSDMDTLVHLRLQGNEEAGMVRDARQLSKTITFLHRYDRPIIKGFYNPCGAITGRFSCTGGDRYDHANLQQIPRRILPCLKSESGQSLVYMDYAGLELRMAVCWIGEPTMHNLIMQGIDVHSHTAKILYHKEAEEQSHHERMIGKICNFLLIYGGSPAILQATARSWGGIMLSMAETRKIYDAWFEEYEYFLEWHKMTKKMLSVYGYMDVNTALGRNVRAYSVNDALNIPVQGSSAEVTKTGLKYLKQRYPDENLISTIHDSNTLMVPDDQVDKWIPRLDDCMVDAWYHVIKDLAIPDLPMPKEAEASKVWDF